MIDPRTRRRARERAAQFLFSLDFTGYAWDEALPLFWTMNESRPTVRRYAERLVRGVCERADSLDSEIAEALEGWTRERVGRVEWATLRIALYEMRHEPDVPVSVAINEAIEVVKRYGADESQRFVNAVLDRLKRKIDQEKQAG